VRTHKVSGDKADFSTEKLIIRGKTLKAKESLKNVYNMADTTAKSTIKSNENNGSKRNELLRKHTDKDNNIELIYSVSHKEIEKEEEEHLMNIFQNHFLFQNFNPEVIRLLIGDLSGYQVEPGTTIYREGEEGTCFFIIKKGRMEVLIGDERKKILHEGDCFGELSLIQKCTRTNSIRALTDVEFYMMDGETYREFRQNLSRTELGDVLFYLDMIPWLKSLDNQFKNNLASLTILNSYEANQKIVYKGNNDDDKIFVIKQGCMFYQCGKQEKRKCYAREYLGEKFIFSDISINFNIDNYSYYLSTLEKTICYVIQKQALEEALGINYREIIIQSYFRELLSKSKFFLNFFMESHFGNLFRIFSLNHYQNGEIVYSAKNSINKKIVIIFEGSLVDVFIYIFINLE
jgi:cGMP-dependent protein kinase